MDWRHWIGARSPELRWHANWKHAGLQRRVGETGSEGEDSITDRRWALRGPRWHIRRPDTVAALMTGAMGSLAPQLCDDAIWFATSHPTRPQLPLSDHNRSSEKTATDMLLQALQTKRRGVSQRFLL